MNTEQKITFRYISATVAAVLLTWLVHELGHWFTSLALGYESAMTLNSVSYEKGENPTDWHRTIVSSAGPAITFMQAVAVFLYYRLKDWNKYLYPLIFTPVYMRILAGVLNVINPNDEGRISAFLGLGTYTIPVIVSGLLLLLLYIVSKRFSLRSKFQLATLATVMVIASLIIVSDMFFKFRLL